MGYHVRVAEPADHAELLDLHGELLHPISRDDLEQRFTWLYERSPHGKAITWVAIDDGTRAMVGCSSFFPRAMTLDGTAVRGALGGDGFVRPSFRRRGVASAMYVASRRGMREHGFEVVFCTPLPQTRGPLANAGSHNVTNIARYVRPLTLKALGVRSDAVNRLASAFMVPSSRARLDPVVSRDGRVEALWQSVRASVGLAARRDAEMYTWRFVDSPTRRQRAYVIVVDGSPIAACALEQVDRSMRVVELTALHEAWGAALRAICNHARGCDAVELRMTREQAAAHSLARHGFVERGDVMPLAIVLPEGDPRSDVFWDPKRWYVTWLETDTDSTT